MGEDMLEAFSGAIIPREVETNLRNNYRIQMDHAFLLSRILEKGVKIVAYSPNIPPKVIKELITPVGPVQEGLDVALRFSTRRRPKVLIYPQAQRTLPILTNKDS